MLLLLFVQVVVGLFVQTGWATQIPTVVDVSRMSERGNGTRCFVNETLAYKCPSA